MTTLTVESPERMAELGALIATRLSAGDLVLLNGDLGAGKTTLTRAIGDALGIRGTVTSPTFVLARTHPRLEASPAAVAPDDAAPLVHVDAYRLGSAVELDDLDIDFDSSIVVVEWGAGLLDGVSESWLNIDIARPTGAGEEASSAQTPADDFTVETIEPRTVTVAGFGTRWTDMEWLNAFSD